MIQVCKIDNRYTFEFLTDPPLVYLDHAPLRKLSSDKQLRRRFLGALQHHGTLALSVPNILDIAGNTGRSADQIRSFLSAVEDRWVILESNPHKMMEHERSSGQRGRVVCFATDFLQAFIPHLYTDNTLCLGRIIDLHKDPELRIAITNSAKEQKKEMQQNLIEWRNRWETEPEDFDPSIQHMDFDQARAARFVFYRLLLLVCKNRFTIQPNDAIDFFHAVTSLTYADIVVLDKKWAELGNSLRLPQSHVLVYSCKADDLDRFLGNFENWRQLKGV